MDCISYLNADLRGIIIKVPDKHFMFPAIAKEVIDVIQFAISITCAYSKKFTCRTYRIVEILNGKNVCSVICRMCNTNLIRTCPVIILSWIISKRNTIHKKIVPQKATVGYIKIDLD